MFRCLRKFWSSRVEPLHAVRWGRFPADSGGKRSEDGAGFGIANGVRRLRLAPLLLRAVAYVRIRDVHTIGMRKTATDIDRGGWMVDMDGISCLGEMMIEGLDPGGKGQFGEVDIRTGETYMDHGVPVPKHGCGVVLGIAVEIGKIGGNLGRFRHFGAKILGIGQIFPG